ncbi:ABC transporter permease [Nocardiopsis sp. NRRL B-16309]|uniref:ABC transporter permease n=1 Tax=Nocardiopsis sp. NRRL B-16309 TaxID=1519494 RepID=UPI0006C36D15|nr:ABC transporter permease [Nocardiopsis sp. NRRL B-16309]KOX17028.1 ABC transporter permease [Nocardiopsis sp. NRRL B-16309]
MRGASTGGGGVAAAAGPVAFGREVAAEGVRQASLRSTWWCVGAAVLGLAAFAAMMGLSSLSRITENAVEADSSSFVQLLSQGHFYIVQFTVLTLAALAATGEFGNGSVTSTLLWTPRRGRLLAARSVVTAGLAFVMGLGATAAGVAVLAVFLGGYVDIDLLDLLTTGVSAGVCMALFAVLFVGLGTALRGTAGTITVGFLLLLGVPLVMQLSGVRALDDLAALLPGLAGIEFYAGGDVGFYTSPHDGAVNVATVAGWAAAAQIVALAELRVRDV